jgi:DNA-binding NtrC family response regulator
MSTKVLVVDDKQMMRDSVGSTLQRAGYLVVTAADGATALAHIARHRPAAVITDLKMPEMDGLELLARIRQADDQIPVVLMTAYGSVNDAVQAMKSGAFDFIQKPFDGEQLVLTIRRAVEHHRLVQENEALKTSAQPTIESPTLVGRTPVMRSLAQQIQQIARSGHATVLIHGESGTGKEVVARTIHAHSPRRDRVMLCVNCAALSTSLLESELFGHEKGAFTGADQLRKGRFELADGGTLLLDEISEISPVLQAKLLRVLQERSFERVGSSLTKEVDVRVIATTNRDLRQSVADGTFRQDLYYRLNVLPIALPPLRDRADDIPLLADHFLARLALREGREAARFDDGAIELLKQYPWPGNVREMENICERASVLARGSMISQETIRPWLTVHESRPAVFAGVPTTTSPAPQVRGEPAYFDRPLASISSYSAHGVATMPPPRPLEETEREQILVALQQFQGNRVRTARALGIGVRTLGLKLKKWKELKLVAATV